MPPLAMLYCNLTVICLPGHKQLPVFFDGKKLAPSTTLKKIILPLDIFSNNIRGLINH
jgi:hypothetical protein